MNQDIAIIGGSFAGLAAALQLVRARRRVVLIDAGLPRNRMADAVHGVPGHDGTPPGQLRAAMLAQVQAYPGLDLIGAEAVRATRDDAGFHISLATGETVSVPRVILASGVEDILPDVPGLAERWGRSVFHCPYCHGYEVSGQRLAVIGFNNVSLVQALVLPDWSGAVTLFPDGKVELSDKDRTALTGRGVAIEEAPVAAIEGEGSAVEAIRLADGRFVEADCVFTLSATRPAGTLAEKLGCKLIEADFGPYVETDFWNQTSVPRLYAAGDMARPFQIATLAMVDGVNAAVGAHHAMVLEG